MLELGGTAAVYCRERAAECEHHAEQVQNAQIQANIHRLARTWRGLADQQDSIQRFESFLNARKALR
jgi:hypothetical protein